jgi:hypothetical protein
MNVQACKETTAGTFNKGYARMKQLNKKKYLFFRDYV